jgi:hypothetical protein
LTLPSSKVQLVSIDENPAGTGVQTMKMKAKSAYRVGRRAPRAAMLAASAATIALSGCYLFSPSQASVDKLQTQLHFDLTQCQQTATNVYKCPAVDKSICGAFYSGPQVDCLYLDKDGNVIVQRQ